MGKKKYIETPELLWEYFLQYKTHVKSNPIIVKDWVGKDAGEVYREKEKPLTIDGFECWCYDNGIISDLSQYFANTEQRYSEYQTICSRIKKAVRTDQIEGGMAGIYNPSITQRLNNLVEKTETNVKMEQPLFPDAD
jgi:hypothetical protein